MKKENLVFKMRNAIQNVEVVATHHYIGGWQKKGFIVVGYKVLNDNQTIMDIDTKDIPNNIK